MSDIARSDRMTGGLSQLKKRLSKASFVIKGGFSGFIFASASFLALFPALPPISVESIVPKEAKETSSQEMKDAELCLWQKDVSFFSSLEDNKKATLQREVPCLEQEKKLAEQKKKDGNQDLSATIEEMAAGYPLAIMANAISEYDRDVAALIVGIAKKESNWGKRVPLASDGTDCFNYWGYKGAGTRGVAMGHGCFGSPEEAVRAVGNRISELVEKRKTSDPKNMIIWKCGSSCATHSPESVRKWIADVDVYYRKIVKN